MVKYRYSIRLVLNRVSHKQLVSIQVLRAIAALSVVIGHIIGKVKHEYSEVPDIYLSFWQISAFGVDIFFIISGVVMVLVSQTDSHDIVQIKRFLKHRLFRIYPVYWVAITCYLAMKLTQVGGLSGIDLEHITFSYLLLPTQTSSGGYYPILGVGWTLVFEVFFYVCYAFTMLVALKYRIAVFLLLFVPLMLIGFIIKRGHTIPGYLASIILVSSLVMLSATMALSAPYVSFENLNQWRVIFWGIPSFLLVYAAINLEGSFNHRGFSVLHHLGDSSYTLYLFHAAIFLPVFGAILNYLNLYSLMSIHLVIVFLIFSCVYLGHRVHLTFERPIYLYLKRKY